MTDDAAAPELGVLTTGRRIHQTATVFEQNSDSTNVLEQRGRTTVVRSDMDDA